MRGRWSGLLRYRIRWDQHRTGEDIESRAPHGGRMHRRFPYVALIHHGDTIRGRFSIARGKLRARASVTARSTRAAPIWDHFLAIKDAAPPKRVGSLLLRATGNVRLPPTRL